MPALESTSMEESKYYNSMCVVLPLWIELSLVMRNSIPDIQQTGSTNKLKQKGRYWLDVAR